SLWLSADGFAEPLDVTLGEGSSAWNNLDGTLHFYNTTPPSCAGSGMLGPPDLHVASSTLAVMATGANGSHENYRLNLIDVETLDTVVVGPELATPVSLRW